MAILTSFWILDLTLFLASLVSGVYLFYLHQFRFWKKVGIKHSKPSFPLGDAEGVGNKENIGEVFKNLYKKYKNEPFLGVWMFFQPILLVNDPEVVKTIFIKDFSSYQDRGTYVNEKEDPLSAHLFAIGGVRWRNLRAKLSPTFTSGKMKMMFQTLVDASKVLTEVLEDPAKKGEVIEVKEIAARFTTDIISSVAFGLDTNSMRIPDNTFRKMGKKVIEPSFRNLFIGILTQFMPDLSALLKLTLTPKDVTEFFMGAVKDTMDYREKNNATRNDFMQLLIQLKNKGHVEDVDKGNAGERETQKFTFNEAAAQAFVFFVAGFETSSTTMQFALYELALHPEIQEKAREEVLKGLEKNKGQMTYEAIFEMQYLGRVIDETLRKYPPVPALQRETMKDVQLGDHIIPKGVQIQVPIWGMHMDPEHFPDPEKFEPDRFTEEEKAKRHHFAYLPFGEGPRNCIGMRFGLMQTRVGLATLLSNFKFEVCKETPVPMVFDKKSFITSPKNGMHLKITSLKK